ncbi:MAG: hypothetical protein JWO38_4236 [Gemmataceae bacterium]|nr:hypothetical protein [Gemmataceae bacterium]
MRVLSCPTCHAAVHVPPEAESGTVTCEACREVIRPADLRPPVPGEPPPPPPVPGKYPVIRFEATTGGAPAGLIVALVTGLVGALVLAVGCVVVRSFFWLVIVFPALH